MDVAEDRIAEIDRVALSFLEERNTLRAVTTEELRRRIKEGDTIVLDVRLRRSMGPATFPVLDRFP